MAADGAGGNEPAGGGENTGSSDGTPLGTLVGGAGWIFGGRIAKLVVGFLVQILLARILGNVGYGSLSLATTVIAFAGLFAGLGISRGVERNVAYYEDEPSKARGIVRAGLNLSLAGHVVTAVAIFVLAPTIANGVFDNPDLTLLLRIAALGMPFMALRSVGKAAATGSRDPKTHVVVSQVLGPLTRSALVAGFVLLGYGAAGAILGQTIARVLMAGVAVWLAWRVFPVDVLGKTKSMYRELLGFSLPLLFAGWMTLFIDETDYLVLGLFHTEDLVGTYTAMFGLRPIILLFFFPATFLLTPVVSRLQKDDSLDQARRSYQAVSKWTTLVSLPLFLLVFLFPRVVIQVSFGADYLSGATVLRVLGLSGLVTIVLGANDRVLIGLGHTRTSMYSNALAALSNVALNLLLIPEFEMFGAAMASLTAFAARNVVNAVLLYRWYGLTPFSPALAKVLGLWSVLVPVGYVGYLAVFPARFLPVTLVGIAFLAVYVPLMIRLGVSESIDFELFEQVEESQDVDLGPVKALFKRLSG